MITDIEISFLKSLSAVQCRFLDVVMIWLSRIADNGIVFILTAAVLLFTKKYRKRGVVLAACLLFGLVVINGVVKPLVFRPRPFVVAAFSLKIPPPTDGSFPSGHTYHAFLTAFVLGKEKKSMGRCALVYAILVAFSRLYLQVHYPTDVFFGIVFAYLTAYLAEKCYTRICCK